MCEKDHKARARDINFITYYRSLCAAAPMGLLKIQIKINLPSCNKSPCTSLIIFVFWLWTWNNFSFMNSPSLTMLRNLHSRLRTSSNNFQMSFFNKTISSRLRKANCPLNFHVNYVDVEVMWIITNIVQPPPQQHVHQAGKFVCVWEDTRAEGMKGRIVSEVSKGRLTINARCGARNVNFTDQACEDPVVVFLGVCEWVHMAPNTVQVDKSSVINNW